MMSLKKKKILVLTTLVVLLLLTFYVFLRIENNSLLEKEEARLQLKMDAVGKVIQSIDTMWNESRDDYENRLHQDVEFMTKSLAKDVTEEGYFGPTDFMIGAVVQVKDGKVIWPEGVPDDFPELSAEDVRQGKSITAVLYENNPDINPVTMVFLPGHIAGDYYFIDWMESDAVMEEQSAFLRDEAFLEKAEDSFGGSLLLVSNEGDSLSLLNQPAMYKGSETAADLGFTPEIIKNRQQIVKVGNSFCLCSYTEAMDGKATLIYVAPVQALRNRCLLHAGLMTVPLLIILATLTVYVLSVQGYIPKYRLSRLLANRYQPKTFRRIILMAGLFGAIVVFIITAVFRTMDTMHEESVIDAKSMSSLFDYLQNVVIRRSDYESSNDADWRIYQANQIANHLARHPEDATKEKFIEFADIYNIDVLMMFDSEGKEVLSNNNYAGFTLDTVPGQDSKDFRRLLLGIAYIVHDASPDPISGVNFRTVGISLTKDGSSGQKPHGALIISIPTYNDLFSAVTSPDQLSFLNNPNRTCFFADPESGEILYAGDESLIGRTVMDCGLPEQSLEDGYTDFANFNGVNSYVTMNRQNSVDFFYVLTSASLLKHTLLSACLATVAYLLIFAIVCLLTLMGYNKYYEKWAAANGVEEDPAHGGSPGGRKIFRNYAELMMTSGKNDYRWNTRTPEKKAALILKIDFLVLVVLPAVLLALGQEDSLGGTSLITFILYGKWVRGLNMFSISAIVLVVVISFVILVACNLVLSLIAGFTGRGGETICRLLYSLCRYAVIITALYYVFEYIGISLATYFAGVGALSLAISIGSRDMISDIIGGIMIIFERQFQVGDYVELDNSRGKVLELGIRSTKLLTIHNDIMYVSNSNIRSIVNKSKNASPCVTELNIVTNDPIEVIEEKFGKALAEIGERNRKIVSDLTLAGIPKVSGGGSSRRDKTVSLRFSCTCKERDYDDVKDFINRELYLFCERENIEIR